MEFLFLMCSVNSNLKLRQVVMKFVFLFQCLISSIWLKILFLKPFFVLKKKTLIFHRIFFPKVLLATVFKNSGICEYCSMFKAKKSLMGPFYKQNLKNRKCSWKFMDTISHSKKSLLGKFYIHQENNALFMTKNVNFAFFSWTHLGHSKKKQL